MIPLPKVTFVIDHFAAPAPGQQLLDRFLIGYNSDGAFRVPGCEVILHGRPEAALESRVRDFGLRISPEALQGARAVVIAAAENRVREAMQEMASGARCFVHGLLSPGAAEIAEKRGLVVRSGTATATSFRLPAVSLAGPQVQKCVIVTTGPAAVIDGLEALRSVVESRISKLGVARKLIGSGVWEAAYSGEWLPLFSAAVSRSNTMKGDPERDGRPQDIAGLRLVEKLVKTPRGWILEHWDGLQTAMLDLTGALDDLNFAVRLNDGSVRSAQIYRPPAPKSDHFSLLAEQIERFFREDAPEERSGTSLWSVAEKMNS